MWWVSNLFWDAPIFCNNFTLPKRRFWKDEQKINADFRSTFQGREYSIWATNRWKLHRKSAFHLLFILPNPSFGDHKLCKMINHLAKLLYTFQTKILDGRTNVSECVSRGSTYKTIRSPNRVLTPLKSASPGNAFGNVGSAFQILRLGGVKLLQKSISFQKTNTSRHVMWCENDRDIGMLSSSYGSCVYAPQTKMFDS